MPCNYLNKKCLLGKLVIACFVFIHSVTAGDTHPSLEDVLKKSPADRLQIYSTVLKNPAIPDDARKLFIKAFAQDARNLSPQYGKSTIRINEKKWIEWLSEGIEVFPEDQNIVFSLIRLLINSKEYKRALQVLKPYHKKHPSHETAAWISYCSDKTAAIIPVRELPVFDIHFCVITKNTKAHRKADLKQLLREVDILNARFRTLQNRQIVKFKFKSASFYNEVKDIGCKFVELGDAKKYDTYKFAEIFNKCRHSKVRDRKAINFYVIDSFNNTQGYNDITCHGKRNSNRPYVLIDWERLNCKTQNPEAHEMGHAFGLYHVAVPGAKFQSFTNIMCSTQYGFGSGGNRRLGFTESQAAIILYHAGRTQQRLS